MPRVLLVAAPWIGTDTPPLALPLLQACVRAAGFECDTLYAYLPLVRGLGAEVYRALIAGGVSSESLFLPHLYGDAPEATASVEAAVAFAQTVAGTAMAAETVVATVDRYVDALSEQVPWHEYDVVGFSVTFAQMTASLALAARIKRVHPAVAIVLGGAQCWGEAAESILREFPQVDYVVDGDGDAALVALISRLQGGPRTPIGGLVLRLGGGIVRNEGAPPSDSLDALPRPDFLDFFHQIAQHGVANGEAGLPIEASRGCRWNRCSFCALNNGRQRYRAKSPDRVAEELVHNVHRYRCLRYNFVDTLFAPGQLDPMLRLLVALRRRYDLTFSGEFRADLTKPQIRLMADAGFERIQLGVESFSSPILKRMRKGTFAAQNIQVLRWCQEAGIEARHNIICGFPSETAGELREMVDTMRLLSHLPAPFAGNFSLERGSPMFAHPAAFGMTVRQSARHQALYRGAATANRQAVGYEFSEALSADLLDARRAVVEQIRQWRMGPRRELSVRDGEEFLEFYDTRDGVPVVRRLTGIAPAAIHPGRALDAARTPRRACGGRIGEARETVLAAAASAGHRTGGVGVFDGADAPPPRRVAA